MRFCGDVLRLADDSPPRPLGANADLAGRALGLASGAAGAAAHLSHGAERRDQDGQDEAGEAGGGCRPWPGGWSLDVEGRSGLECPGRCGWEPARGPAGAMLWPCPRESPAWSGAAISTAARSPGRERRAPPLLGCSSCHAH